MEVVEDALRRLDRGEKPGRVAFGLTTARAALEAQGERLDAQMQGADTL